MAKEKNEVAVKETAGVPAVIDFMADAGKGFEGADSGSFAIPFIRLLQAMSPQVKKSEAAYIKGAEEGQIFNTVTEELVDGEVGIQVVPCAYEHFYLLWAPNRGGLRGRLSLDEYAKCKKQTLTNDKGNQYEADMEGNAITDTRQHYVLILKGDGSATPALISMASTQIKKSKKWMSLMDGIKIQGMKAPMFSQIYTLKGVADPPKDGNTWMGWKIEHHSQVTSPEIYQQAKAFNEMVLAGNVTTAPIDDETM